MDAVSRFATREAASATLVGSIPFTITAYFGGLEAVVSSLKALNPSPAILAWYGVLLFLPGIVRMLQIRFPDKNLSRPGFLTWLRDVVDNSSKSLHGLYRAAAGYSALVMIPVLVIEHSARSLAVASYMLLFSAGCLVVCCVLSAWRK